MTDQGHPASNTRRSALAQALALAIALSPAGFVAAQDTLPEAVREFDAYLADFDARHPDPSKVDIDATIEAEGERIALLYCRASGFDGACVPGKDDDGFVPASTRTATTTAVPWWGWIWNFIGGVGVIPQSWACGPYAPVQMHMDDAAAPSPSSWIGATLTGADTTWRLCKVNWPTSWQFKRLSPVPDLYRDYGVQRFGVFCPPGSVGVRRYQANVPGNGNWSTGPIFPNIRIPGAGWYTWVCLFDTAPSGGPQMTTFPALSLSAYGVYASRGLRQPNYPSLGNGYVYQRDHAVSFWNWTTANPFNWVLQGSSTHTMRFLARVQ